MKRKKESPKVDLPEPLRRVQISDFAGRQEASQLLTSPTADADLLARSDLERHVLEHGRQVGRVGRRQSLYFDATLARRPDCGRHNAALRFLLQLEVCEKVSTAKKRWKQSSRNLHSCTRSIELALTST